MRSRLLIIVLAVLAFAVVLLMRLPLAWVTGLLPEGIRCGSPAGSVWDGGCGQLSVTTAPGNALDLGTVAWQLERAALLGLAVRADVRFDGPQIRGGAHVDARRGGNLRVTSLSATAPLDRRLLSMVPANWTGSLRLEFPHVEVADGRLTALQGVLEAHDIVAQGPRPDSFGSYAIEFPAPAVAQSWQGRLRDLSGPVELGGTLTLQPTFDWELDALVAARPSATPQLSRLIEYLGPPDAQGRRRFSAAGDF